MTGEERTGTVTAFDAGRVWGAVTDADGNPRTMLEAMRDAGVDVFFPTQVTDVMRTGGTSKKTGDQLDEELENMAAAVESSMGETSASVSFSGLKENVDPVLEVFKGVLTDPEFRQDKVDLIAAQSHSAITRRNDDAQGISERELTSTLYGHDNSYGWLVEHEHINRIKREDLQQFYHRYYFPKNIMLGIYGDFSTAEMRAKLEALFKDWTVEQPAPPPFPAVVEKPMPGVFYAEKTDVTQAFSPSATWAASFPTRPTESRMTVVAGVDGTPAGWAAGGA